MARSRRAEGPRRLPDELTVRPAGVVELHLEGTSGLAAPLAAWVRDVVQPLEEVPASREGPLPRFTLRFVERLRPQGRPLGPLPAVPADGALLLADHLGRGARLPLAALDAGPLEVDRAIDPWFFEPWVYMPLVRAALWRSRTVLVHAAALRIHDRRVMVTGWEGSGKSRVMYELLRRGADLLADDWAALSPEGEVGPITGHVALTDAHRAYVPPHRWPGGRSVLRRAAVSSARSMARGLERFPLASKGMSRIAEAWGPTTLVVRVDEVFPGASLAPPGRLDTLLVLSPPGARVAPTELAADLVVAQNRTFLADTGKLEAAHEYAFPGALEHPVFPTPDQEREALAEALTGVEVRTRSFSAGDEDVRRVADDLSGGGALRASDDGRA